MRSTLCIQRELISLEKALEIVDDRPNHVELVFTGRHAKPELIEKADLVTEMRKVKHHFDQGIRARIGIEFVPIRNPEILMAPLIFLRVFLPFALSCSISYFFRNVNAIIEADLVRDLSFSAASLGLLTSVYFISFASFQLPLGLLLDRFGPRGPNPCCSSLPPWVR